VLYQALFDAQGRSGEDLQKDAETWLFTTVTSLADDFEEVCILAGLRPVDVRRITNKIFKPKATPNINPNKKSNTSR